MPRAGTAAAIADYMLHEFWNDRSSGARFDIADGGKITVDLSGLDARGQQLARWAMASWESVAGIDFAEVRRGAEVKFTDGGSGPVTTYVFSGQTIVGATLNVPQDYIARHGGAMDQYAYQVYLHEIGHLFGLGHPGPYDGGASFSEAIFANDSWQMTVMSYFSQNENPNVGDTRAVVMTPMEADIAALQGLYGPPDADPTRGATVWGAGTNLDSPLGAFFRAWEKGGAAHSNDAFSFLLRDAGGTDLVDFSLDNRPQNVRLDAFIDIINPASGSQHAHVLIDKGTVIENYRAGDGADRVVGNGADNVLRLGGNSDVARGRGGDDRILGEDGHDRLFGNGGDDVLSGGDALDILLGGGGADRLLGGIGNDVLKGGAGGDRLEGGDHLDTLQGGAGADRLDGGAHADLLTGGGGRDSFVITVGGGTDTITDFTPGRDLLLLEAGLLAGTDLATILARPGDMDGDPMLRFGTLGDRLVLEDIRPGELAGLIDDIVWIRGPPPLPSPAVSRAKRSRPLRAESGAEGTAARRPTAPPGGRPIARALPARRPADMAPKRRPHPWQRPPGGRACPAARRVFRARNVGLRGRHSPETGGPCPGPALRPLAPQGTGASTWTWRSRARGFRAR